MMLSVIIPTYNAEHTISSCIESVLQQDIDDYEIIVVNDGSTDDTRKILDKLQMIHESLRVFHIKNGGVSHARNYGITHCNGDLLFFLDSDDYLEKNCLKELMRSYQLHGADLVAAEIIDNNGTSIAVKNWFGKVGSFYVVDDDSMGENMMYIRMGSAVGKLYKKSIIQEKKIFFDNELALAEDSIFVHNYILKCSSIEKNASAKYIVRNVNINSLSKRYINNIEKCIETQILVMKKVFEAYPQYKQEWYTHTMDIEACGCTIFAQNLFLEGCPFKLCQKYKEMKRYLQKNNRLSVVRKASKENGPKNRIDKIQWFVIKIGLVPLILMFFWLKESVKKTKIRVSGRNKE